MSDDTDNLKTELATVTTAPASTNVTASFMAEYFILIANQISQSQLRNEHSRHSIVSAHYTHHLLSDNELLLIGSSIHLI